MGLIHCSFFDLESLHIFFPFFSSILNKWFLHYQVFSIVFFHDFWSSECDVVLFVVMCGVVWICLLLRCSFGSYWKNEYFGELDFMILYIGILSLHVINLSFVSLFVDSPFLFLAMLIMLLYVIHFINLKEWISFSFCKKKIYTIL